MISLNAAPYLCNTILTLGSRTKLKINKNAFFRTLLGGESVVPVDEYVQIGETNHTGSITVELKCAAEGGRYVLHFATPVKITSCISCMDLVGTPQSIDWWNLVVQAVGVISNGRLKKCQMSYIFSCHLTWRLSQRGQA